MRLTPLPAAALFALACTGTGDDKAGHSGGESTTVAPAVPPDTGGGIGLPIGDHTGYIGTPLPEHTALIGTPPAHTGGSGATTSAAPAAPPTGLSPRPAARVTEP